ncbi:anthranilate synthase, phenazine specific [Streptomyces himastatinicus ATCC 53653]|uniref:anthranilate synthase n=1 Tax=Streptomyces himastatinicus ATCC 53653 TaxID=457427 RepID=D9WU15_9ACTN|nr:phenazine-specific anthranilate synthase component I [Streptomyces himastatinicus]EFL22263.1 anthranilate synthase, phenazine specific [Streptomyces himastatinicus ATCC 53653]
MTSHQVTGFRDTDAQDLLQALVAPDPPPFALLRRACAGGHEVEVLTGTVAEVGSLAELPSPGPAKADAGAGSGGPAEVLAVIPFRQVTERGYACNDDGEPILALTAERRAALPVKEALDLLPDAEVALRDAGFDIGDEDYEKVVEKILDQEIRAGEGSNFVIRRSFRATLGDYRPEVALTVFRRLLTMESGAYWTFVVHTGDRTFVGASPELHVQVDAGTARMNPISGTYRYPPSGADLDGVLEFLGDQKETDELFMVVDEELKMLARVCDRGARARGPHLREMAKLAHTEYLLEGATSRDVREVLRETMFAPTITGSPLENACRVIARHEESGRGYYGGALALLGRDATGRDTLDSAILIRTADIGREGDLRVDVGATLVRDSRPAAEVAETWAKVDALLTATGLEQRGAVPAAPVRPAGGGAPLAHDPKVLSALERRNAGLSAFWLGKEDDRPVRTAGPDAGRVLIVDAEDMFTGMLGHQTRSLGLDATIRPWDAVHPATVDGYDCVVLGPGPGDPRATTDPKVRGIADLIGGLFARGIPFVGECLSHQVLCALLGLELFPRERPNQGTQRRIDFFGRSEPVGFYNSYAARHTADRLYSPLARGAVELCRNPATGEVHAVRGERFAATQFHLESVLTEHGTDLLADLLGWALRQPAELIECEADR